MSKTLRALLVAASILTTGQAFASGFMDIPPAQGLPTCAGVYVTMQAYASPENKRVLQDRATTIAMASKRYNPNGPDDAIALARNNIQRINANNKALVDTIVQAEKNCRIYTAKYGI